MGGGITCLYTPPWKRPGHAPVGGNVEQMEDEKRKEKTKKRRVYEHSAPVYDNRLLCASDLLQTQLDYPGHKRKRLGKPQKNVSPLVVLFAASIIGRS